MCTHTFFLRESKKAKMNFLRLEGKGGQIIEHADARHVTTCQDIEVRSIPSSTGSQYYSRNAFEQESDIVVEMIVDTRSLCTLDAISHRG